MRSGIKAVEVAGRILEVLSSAHSPVALRDIAAASRMSPGKVHRYLSSFLSSGLARQDTETRRYILGPLAMRLGLAALNSYQPLRDAVAFQRKIRDQIDESLVLSVWGAQGPTIVHVEESSQPIIMTMRVGAVLPILSSATGLVFAAFLPRHFTKSQIVNGLKAKRGFKVFSRDPTAIERLISNAREQHYAYNRGYLMPDVSALAFPLFDRSGSLFAVMAVMGRDEHLNPRKRTDLLTFLRDAASAFNRPA